MKELSENLKRLRESRNLTRTELAQFLNIAPSAYSAYENGKVEIGDREPNLKNLIKLADFFNVSVDELLNHSFNEFERCKSLWESLQFDVQMQEGKIILKQLQAENYHHKGKSRNFLAYASAESINFDNTKDFIEFTQTMEKQCHEKFFWNCRKFFWNFSAIGLLSRSDYIDFSVEAEKKESPHLFFDYKFLKNKIFEEQKNSRPSKGGKKIVDFKNEKG